MTDKTLNWYNAISLTMTLGEHAKTFREVFNQECLDNISRYGFIKKQLWDMQVGLINEESCEFLDAAEELYADPEDKDKREHLVKELSDLVFVCYQFAAAFNIDLDEAKKLDFADLEEEIPVIEKGLDEMNFAEKYENQIENVNSKIDMKGILVDSSNRTDSRKRKVKTRLDFSNGLSNAPDPVNKSLGTGGRMSKESERINKENNRDLIEQFDDISNKENMSSNESLFEDGLILGDENVRKLVTSTPAANSINVNRRQNSLKKSEHTPSHHKDNIFEFPEGSFFGLGRHCDGSEINIMYQV